jgi:hypothetical protein
MKKILLIIPILFSLSAFSGDNFLKNQQTYESNIFKKTVAVIKGKYKKVAIVKVGGNYKIITIEKIR